MLGDLDVALSVIYFDVLLTFEIHASNCLQLFFLVLKAQHAVLQRGDAPQKSQATV